MLIFHGIEIGIALFHLLFYIQKLIDTKDYHVKETHDFTMCLGKDYYEPYNNWIRVCFALRNTDSRLFLTWVKFSSKSSKFSFDKIGEMYDMWQRKNYDYDNNEILTKRSIMYWAKQDNPKEFQRVKDESIETFIEKAVETPTEVDCANILYHLKKEKYVCGGLYYLKRNIINNFPIKNLDIDRDLILKVNYKKLS